MKKFSLILALLAIAISANAQLLWKISGNGLQKPSYLFGTHHVAPATMIDSVKGASKALASVDKVYGEIDMAVMNDMAALMKVQQATMAPADSTLSKVFSADELKKIDGLLAQSGVPATTAMLEPVKPAALSNMIALALSQKAFPDFDPSQQLDATIQTKARNEGKPIGGLETMDSQVELLYGTPISVQADDIRKTLDDIESCVESTRLMSEAYLAHDINKLYSIFTDPKTGMTEAEAERMIYSRNNTWVELLTGLLPTASIFIAVGAGHLPGEKGLVNLLRKAGYNVEPID